MDQEPRFPMESPDDIVRYIFHNYLPLLNAVEHQAHYYVILQAKADHSDNPKSHLHSRKTNLAKDHPEAMRLLANGNRAFFASVVKRLKREHTETIFFNRCPKCGTLCRTPQACLCPGPACNHTWYETRA